MKINIGILICLAVVLIVITVEGILLTNFVTSSFKNDIIGQKIDVYAKFIVLKANQILTAEDFNPDNLEKKGETFSYFLNRIDTEDIVGLRVWSADKTVLYSNDQEIADKTANYDEEVNAALGGKLVSKISYLKNSESILKNSYSDMLIIFVPIKSDSNKVIGVIGTHVSMDSINSYIRNESTTVSLIAYFGIILSGLAILVTYYTFRKNIIKPIRKIHENAKKIGSGDLEINSNPIGFDELQNLAKEMIVTATLLKEQQEKIVKTERLSAIGELAARLAHDLRNPLYVIRMVLYVIQNKYGINSEINKDVLRINLAMQRMSNQIESVLNFVAIKPLRIEEASISRILKSVIKNLDFVPSIKINFPTNDITLDCDRDKLEVVFENIFHNAIQAMKDVGILNIRIIEDADLVRIEIEDSGPGIPDEILPKIFDPLFTTKQEGTGLGLPSCKNIIEQHKGSIKVKTEINKGTTIIITLPIKISSQHNSPVLSQITNTQVL